MQWDRFRRGALDILLHLAIGGVQGIRFGRERRDRRRPGPARGCLPGMPMKSTASRAAMRERQRIRIGEADVFHGHADYPARDVKRIFSSFEHTSQPIERGIGIAVAHRFMERGDQVVMLFAGLVVEQNAALQGIVNDLVGNLRAGLLAGLPASQRRRNFQHVVGAARVAARISCDFCAMPRGEAVSFMAPRPRSWSASARCNRETICFSVRG